MKLRKIRDLTGMKFNKWTVVSLVSRGHNTVWLCRCECGFEKSMIPSNLVGGNSKQCRKCHHKGMIKGNKEKISPTIYGRIRYGADSRNIEFDLSIEYCQLLYEKQGKKCALTQLPIIFSETSSGCGNGKTTASLDRIDSLKGYTTDNVQWIHKDINRMKNCFDKHYFQKICELVYKNRKYKLPKVIIASPQKRKEAKKRIKISNEDVVNIRLRYSNGEKGKDLAREYNCTPSNISYIVNGASRRDIK